MLLGPEPEPERGPGHEHERNTTLPLTLPLPLLRGPSPSPSVLLKTKDSDGNDNDNDGANIGTRTRTQVVPPSASESLYPSSTLDPAEALYLPSSSGTDADADASGRPRGRGRSASPSLARRVSALFRPGKDTKDRDGDAKDRKVKVKGEERKRKAPPADLALTLGAVDARLRAVVALGEEDGGGEGSVRLRPVRGRAGVIAEDGDGSEDGKRSKPGGRSWWSVVGGLGGSEPGLAGARKGHGKGKGELEEGRAMSGYAHGAGFGYTAVPSDGGGGVDEEEEEEDDDIRLPSGLGSAATFVDGPPSPYGETHGGTGSELGWRGNVGGWVRAEERMVEASGAAETEGRRDLGDETYINEVASARTSTSSAHTHHSTATSLAALARAFPFPPTTPLFVPPTPRPHSDEPRVHEPRVDDRRVGAHAYPARTTTVTTAPPPIPPRAPARPMPVPIHPHTAHPAPRPHHLLPRILTHLPRRALPPLALVSRAFAHAVRAALLAPLVLDGLAPRAAEALLALLLSRPDVRSQVRAVVWTTWTTWWRAEDIAVQVPDTRAVLLSATLQLALARLPKLERVVLPSFDAALLSCLGPAPATHAHGMALRSLTLHTPALSRDALHALLGWLARPEQGGIRALHLPRLELAIDLPLYEPEGVSDSSSTTALTSTLTLTSPSFLPHLTALTAPPRLALLLCAPFSSSPSVPHAPASYTPDHHHDHARPIHDPPPPLAPAQHQYHCIPLSHPTEYLETQYPETQTAQYLEPHPAQAKQTHIAQLAQKQNPQHAQRRPLSSLTLHITDTLYTGLRPRALMSDLALALGVGVRVGGEREDDQEREDRGECGERGQGGQEQEQGQEKINTPLPAPAPINTLALTFARTVDRRSVERAVGAVAHAFGGPRAVGVEISTAGADGMGQVSGLESSEEEQDGKGTLGEGEGERKGVASASVCVSESVPEPTSVSGSAPESKPESKSKSNAFNTSEPIASAPSLDVDVPPSPSTPPFLDPVDASAGTSVSGLTPSGGGGTTITFPSSGSGPTFDPADSTAIPMIDTSAVVQASPVIDATPVVDTSPSHMVQALPVPATGLPQTTANTNANAAQSMSMKAVRRARKASAHSRARAEVAAARRAVLEYEGAGGSGSGSPLGDGGREAAGVEDTDMKTEDEEVRVPVPVPMQMPATERAPAPEKAPEQTEPMQDFKLPTVDAPVPTPPAAPIPISTSALSIKEERRARKASARAGLGLRLGPLVPPVPPVPAAVPRSPISPRSPTAPRSPTRAIPPVPVPIMIPGFVRDGPETPRSPTLSIPPVPRSPAVIKEHASGHTHTKAESTRSLRSVRSARSLWSAPEEWGVPASPLSPGFGGLYGLGANGDSGVQNGKVNGKTNGKKSSASGSSSSSASVRTVGSVNGATVQVNGSWTENSTSLTTANLTAATNLNANPRLNQTTHPSIATPNRLSLPFAGLKRKPPPRVPAMVPRAAVVRNDDEEADGETTARLRAREKEQERAKARWNGYAYVSAPVPAMPAPTPGSGKGEMEMQVQEAADGQGSGKEETDVPAYAHPHARAHALRVASAAATGHTAPPQRPTRPTRELPAAPASVPSAPLSPSFNTAPLASFSPPPLYSPSRPQPQPTPLAHSGTTHQPSSTTKKRRLKPRDPVVGRDVYSSSSSSEDDEQGDSGGGYPALNPAFTLGSRPPAVEPTAALIPPPQTQSVLSSPSMSSSASMRSSASAASMSSLGAPVPASLGLFAAQEPLLGFAVSQPQAPLPPGSPHARPAVPQRTSSLPLLRDAPSPPAPLLGTRTDTFGGAQTHNTADDVATFSGGKWRAEEPGVVQGHNHIHAHARKEVQVEASVVAQCTWEGLRTLEVGLHTDAPFSRSLSLSLSSGGGGSDPREEAVYRALSGSLARYARLAVLRLYRMPVSVSASIPDSPAEEITTTVPRLTPKERALLDGWARACPSLRIVELFSGARWERGQV